MDEVQHTFQMRQNTTFGVNNQDWAINSLSGNLAMIFAIHNEIKFNNVQI